MRYKDAQEFIDNENVIVRITWCEKRPDKIMTDMSRHFKCKLSRKGCRNSMTIYFSQGDGHTKYPTPAEVVDCLVQDTPSFDMNFYEFCDEYGYSVEDKSAKRIHKACIKNTNAWLRVFDDIPFLEQSM